MYAGKTIARNSRRSTIPFPGFHRTNQGDLCINARMSYYSHRPIWTDQDGSQQDGPKPGINGLLCLSDAVCRRTGALAARLAARGSRVFFFSPFRSHVAWPAEQLQNNSPVMNTDALRVLCVLLVALFFRKICHTNSSTVISPKQCEDLAHLHGRPLTHSYSEPFFCSYAMLSLCGFTSGETELA